MTDERIARHPMPKYFLDAPHMVFRDGIIAQPGLDNDYSVDDGGDDAVLEWHEPLRRGEVTCVVRLDTGERWAWSTEEGVYVDTRK